jgi:hypothetical protein
MEPTVPLPVPPKDHENVAFYFTQVNVTADAGTMYSKQCWIRSATATHNLTVDSQGFVTNRTRVTSLEINNDALAGGQYRLNKLDSTSIAASIEGFNAFLRSRTYFWKREDDLNDAKRGSLGSSNTIQDSHLENYTTIDPTSYVVNMLNDVYFRAGAIAGFPATDFQPIDPDLPFDQRQLLPRETTGTRTDPNGTVYLIKMRWYIIATRIQGFAMKLLADIFRGIEWERTVLVFVISIVVGQKGAFRTCRRSLRHRSLQGHLAGGADSLTWCGRHSRPGTGAEVLLCCVVVRRVQGGRVEVVVIIFVVR